MKKKYKCCAERVGWLRFIFIGSLQSACLSSGTATLHWRQVLQEFLGWTQDIVALLFKYLKDVPAIHFGRCRASTPEGPWAQPSQTIHPALPGSFPLHQQAEQGRSPWQKQVGKHRLWGLLGVQGHCHGQQGHQQKAVAALWGFLTLFRTVCLSGLLQCAWSLPAKMLSYFHRQKIADYLRKGGGILFPTEKNKLTFHMLHFWKLSQQLELLFLLWRKYSNRGRLHIPPYSPPLLL